MTFDRFCTNCSAEILAGAKFCQNCGHQIQFQETSTEDFFKSKSWKYLQLLAAFLILVIAGTFFLTPKESSTPVLNYQTLDSTNQEIDSGNKACDSAGESSANGRYVCLGGYWVEQQVREIETTRQGRWITNCINVNVPNPNYDSRKGFSAFVNEPYITQEQCNQAYVYE